LVGIATSDDQWHEYGCLIAHRSWILQLGKIAPGWTPKFEGRAIERTILTIQAALIVRQPICVKAVDVCAFSSEKVGTGEKCESDYIGSH